MEFVDRKGIGHPDSICDAIMENVSIALCSEYLAAFDRILHYNVDKGLLIAGRTVALQSECPKGGGREAFPAARPRIISDRGSQFVAKDFKEFIRFWQTTHVLCSPHYPQSNRKLERFHRTLKEQAIRPKTPLCQEDARRLVGEFIEHYTTVRLHSAIGFVTPKDMHEGRAQPSSRPATGSSKELAPGAQRTGRPATTDENPPGQSLRSISLA